MNLRALQGPQLVLLIVFCLVNFLLFSQAVDYPIDGKILSATFSRADDGQRYWGVATALVDLGRFVIPQDNYSPLATAGPLTPIILAVFIKLVGLQMAPLLIVAFQCALLFWMGLFSRDIAKLFKAPPVLTQALVIFNPNLLGLAHYAQSDLLFSFLFTLFCWITICKINQRWHINPRWFFAIGLTLGLMMLTRDAGKLFAITIIPGLFLFLFFQKPTYKPQVRIILSGLLITSLAAATIYAPWVARNYAVFGKPTAISSERQFRINYALLVKHRDGISYDQVNLEAWGDHSPLNSTTAGGDCPESQPFFICFGLAVVAEDLRTITTALASAWSATFLAGGATRLVIYIGASGGLSSFYSGIEEYITVSEYPRFLFNLFDSQHKQYIGIFSLVTSFVVLTRLAGLIGLVSLVRARSNLPGLLFFLTSISLFLAMYLFVGVGRFRAPFEPILMLLASIGLNSVRVHVRMLFRSLH